MDAVVGFRFVCWWVDLVMFECWWLFGVCVVCGFDLIFCVWCIDLVAECCVTDFGVIALGLWFGFVFWFGFWCFVFVCVSGC